MNHVQLSRSLALGLWVLLAGVNQGCDATTASRLAREESPADAYPRLVSELKPFRVAGEVRTDHGLLLPEQIRIEVRSEICVESREPGSRFWSLEYDTCFVYTAVDTVDEKGRYEVAVPSLEPDHSYESRHGFGELRLVQRGPVQFLAESDAGWKHQETFRTARTQTRDLILSLDTDTFWVVAERGALRRRPAERAALLESWSFGTDVEVIRFHNGWAQCLRGNQIGWIPMSALGTEEDVKRQRTLRKQGIRRRQG